MGDGSLFVIVTKDENGKAKIGDKCYLKYREFRDGKWTQRTVLLCERDDRFTWSRKEGRPWSFSKAVRQLQREKMDAVRAAAKAEADAMASEGQPKPPSEMLITEFYDTAYLPWLTEVVAVTGQPRRKASTIHGFKQIWGQHLSKHFAGKTLGEYRAKDGQRFLDSLCDTHRKNSIKHVKALASSIFSLAVKREIIAANPFSDVAIPEGAVDGVTLHYTLEEAEDIISALVEHPDAQLVIALACFLGLRPAEIAGLQWEDFDGRHVHIRRNVIRGEVGTLKTLESAAPLPYRNVPAVALALEAWSHAVIRDGKQLAGWVFASESGTPADLHNLVNRVIRPHVEGAAFKQKGKSIPCVRCGKVVAGSRIAWKGLYAGRRGAGTAVIERNNGNIHAGQGLLRHKSASTTLQFYKKAITPQALEDAIGAMAAGQGRKKIAARSSDNN